MEYETERFFAIVAVFNPGGLKSRYKMFGEFEARMKASGVNLFVAECAFGDEPFAVTSEKNPLHIQLRSRSILWLKENLINICASKLPTQWKYMAWIDPDVEFENPDWVCDCVKELKKYKVVQMFEECVFLDKSNAPVLRRPGFVYKHIKGTFSSPSSPDTRSKSKGTEASKSSFPFDKEQVDGTNRGHPGCAWAICRDAYEMMGGLVDFAVTGAADTFMAYGFIGQMTKATVRIKNKEYLESMQMWERKALDAVRKNVGYVKGNVKHYWHADEDAGDQQYLDREKILNECNFNPKTDIKKDLQGVYQFVNPASKLSQRLYQYFINSSEEK